MLLNASMRAGMQAAFMLLSAGEVIENRSVFRHFREGGGYPYGSGGI